MLEDMDYSAALHVANQLERQSWARCEGEPKAARICEWLGMVWDAERFLYRVPADVSILSRVMELRRFCHG